MTQIPTGKYIVIDIKRFDVPSGRSSDIDCLNNYVEFEVTSRNHKFQSKRFCRRDDQRKTFKYGPLLEESQLSAKFIRGDGNVGPIEDLKGKGFKIDMFWVEDANIYALPAAPKPATMCGIRDSTTKIRYVKYLHN